MRAFKVLLELRGRAEYRLFDERFNRCEFIGPLCLLCLEDDAVCAFQKLLFRSAYALLVITSQIIETLSYNVRRCQTCLVQTVDAMDLIPMHFAPLSDRH